MVQIPPSLFLKMKLERTLREEYLDVMKRFESGASDVSVRDVFSVSVQYFFSHPLEYLLTFKKRLSGENVR